MDEKRLDGMLKSYFSVKLEPDERLKAQIKQKSREKSEKRDNILLCVIQAAMTLLFIAIAAVVFISASGSLMPVLIIGGILAGNLICVAVVIIQSKNYRNRRNNK